MEKLFIVTGAAGHLGGALLRLLSSRGFAVRALTLPGQTLPPGPFEQVAGDVREIDSLRPLFENADGRQLHVLHAAGIVDIAMRATPLMRAVNVTGTKNIIDLCRQYGARLLYVSSVHAIPEGKPLSVISETSRFSPDQVTGGYAKTKAEATQAVLDAARQGLDAVVVHPSGILGPYEGAGNHLVQLLRDYLAGRLPACVNGGYDIVDVRDAAWGCVEAALRGRTGECYILSNRHWEVKEILSLTRDIVGGRKLILLPMWLARAAAPLLAFTAKIRNIRPLYTAYSLLALRSNDRFSHNKATSELGYSPRPLSETIADTVAWMREHPE